MNTHDLETSARAVVRRELGERPVAARRILVGHSNHVVKVDAVSGRSFAVRLSKLGPGRFDMEHAVMALVADVGVPVPPVRFVGPGAANDDPPEVMVLDWVDAPSLDTVRDVAATERQELNASLALTLATIHSCELRGFGNLDARLRGPADDFVAWFVTGALEQIERSADVIAAIVPEDAGLPAMAADALAREAPILADAPGNLAHGDFSPSNLLVSGTDLEAVIDWEGAKAGPPALDFGWLAYIDIESTIDREGLMQRYAAITGHDLELLSAQSRLVELRILATAAEWQARAQLRSEIPATLRRLAERLRHR